MKLFHNPASPFVRKVMVCAHELGVADRLELETVVTSPVEQSPALVAASGYAKIPTLVLDDGSLMVDSRVICEFLDTLTDRAGMVPASGPARWTALRMAALGDGLCDTAVGLRYELLLRPKQFQWDDWIEAQSARLRRSLDEIESKYLDDIAGLDIGAISIACALGYLDFRFADMAWRDGRPGLAAWYATFSRRPSMTMTVPDPA